MRVSELALRYSKAAFDLACENKNQEKVFTDLRALSELIEKDQDIKGYLASPLISADAKTAVLEKAVAGAGLSAEAHQLLTRQSQWRFSRNSSLGNGAEHRRPSADRVDR